MSVIIEFLTTFANGIIALIDFVIGMVGDLVYFVKILAESTAALPAFITWLPGGLVAILVLTLTVVVILRVLGRD